MSPSSTDNKDVEATTEANPSAEQEPSFKDKQDQGQDENPWTIDDSVLPAEPVVVAQQHNPTLSVATAAATVGTDVVVSTESEDLFSTPTPATTEETEVKALQVKTEAETDEEEDVDEFKDAVETQVPEATAVAV